MKKQVLHTIAASVGSIAFSLLFAASAHAAQGDLLSITLYDTDVNGRIDQVDIAVDNPTGHIWTKEGTPVYHVKYNGGADMTVMSSGPQSASVNPLIISLGLDETTGGLAVDTTNALLEVTYNQVLGTGSCTNCFRDTLGNKEAPAIAADDTGADVEIDAMKPILTSVTPAVGATGVGTGNALVLNFSEPMTTIFTYGTVAAMFSASPNPGGWSEAFTNNDKTVTLTHTGFLKQTAYTLTLYPGAILASGGNPGTLDGAGALVSLTGGDHYSFTTTGGGSANTASPYVPYVAPTYACSVLAPTSGTILKAGSNVEITWSSSSEGISNVLLSYTKDDGKTWSTIGSDNNDSSYVWGVPSTLSGVIHFKVDCRESGGGLLATAQSDALTVSGASTAVLVPAPALSPAPFMAHSVGTLLKAAGLSAVYYYGDDSKRHPFPNETIFKTWYADFSGVQEFTLAEIAQYTMGKPMLPKPGTLLFKIQSDPKTYWIDPLDNKAHWLMTEATAARIAGADWNTKIIDIDVTLFSAVTFGVDIQ